MTEPLDLTPYLAQAEGQYFDRKSLFEGRPGSKAPADRKKVRDMVARWVAGFANADGGLLILGVEDDGTVTGHGYPDDAVGHILDAPRHLRPPQASGRRMQLEDREVLVFDVPASPVPVVAQSGGCPYRTADKVIDHSEAQVAALKAAGHIGSWEAQPSTATMADLDLALIERAASETELRGAGPEAYLLRRGLADRRGGALVLRRAAVMLFARDVVTLDHPTATVRIFRVDGREQRRGADRNVRDLPRLEGNLPTLIEAAYGVLRQQIRSSTKLHDLFFREVPEYPTFAWQEAIVNAIAHRDYAVQARGVEVWLYDDRMEVTSPGRLLADITIEELAARNGTHASRNPRCARCLADLGFMRETGEGIPRMFEEMEVSYLPLPELSADAARFTVVLRNTPYFDVVDREWAAAVREMPLRSTQKRALIGFGDGRFFSNDDYRKLNGVDRDVAYRELRELVEHGNLVPRGAGSGTEYRVARTADEAPPEIANPASTWLASALQEGGSVSNASVREALGLDRSAAKRLLRDWSERGLVEVEGERRGARWVPGPAFARWSRLVLGGAKP